MLPGVLAGAITAFSAALGEFGAVITFVSNIPGETRTLRSPCIRRCKPGRRCRRRLAWHSYLSSWVSGSAPVRMVSRSACGNAGSMMLKVAVKKTRGSFALDAGFEMPTAGFVALFGRSGCGKSTLVNIIAGLLDATPDTSRSMAMYCSTRIQAGAYRRSAAASAMYFKNARLFPHLRVAANLRYGERRAEYRPT